MHSPSDDVTNTPDTPDAAVRVIGDILEAFVVDIPGISEAAFDALSEDEQKGMVAAALKREGRGLHGLGAERDLRIDSTETLPTS
jgi:NAD(P)H-dependent FMN reductase